MNILGVIHVRLTHGADINTFTRIAQRYLTLKDLSPEKRKKVNKKVVFFAGKAAPAC
jgi:hypothetical protein